MSWLKKQLVYLLSSISVSIAAVVLVTETCRNDKPLQAAPRNVRPDIQRLRGYVYEHLDNELRCAEHETEHISRSYQPDAHTTIRIDRQRHGVQAVVSVDGVPHYWTRLNLINIYLVCNTIEWDDDGDGTADHGEVEYSAYGGFSPGIGSTVPIASYTYDLEQDEGNGRRRNITTRDILSMKPIVGDVNSRIWPSYDAPPPPGTCNP